MSKPIVVLMPKAEREALRECETLPSDFFSETNPHGVRLWPHDIDYSVGPSIAATIAERPGDVPVFFGFPESTSSAEIDERTAKIVEVVRSVMVHVVFLDDYSPDGGISYGHLSSFRGIIDWSKSLMQVLSVRFNGEDLHHLESVLVVVVRGQQIKISESELREFSEIIGESSEGCRRPFRSCYFLNHELSIDDGVADVFASNVWDIVVGRLLKAFVLSREQNPEDANSQRSVWMRPGIKIWKSEECIAAGVNDVCNREIDRILEEVDKRLQDKVAGGDDTKVELTPPAVGSPGGGVEEDPLIGNPGNSWSQFDPVGLVASVESSAKRAQSVAEAARKYFAWRREVCRPDQEEPRRIFSSVDNCPCAVFSRINDLTKVLGAQIGATRLVDVFHRKFGEIVKTETERREVLFRLSHPEGVAGKDDPGGMAQELDKAQRHYVGLGIGVIVVAAVVAMCGWISWQVVKMLDGSPTAALVLISSAAAGSFVAMIVHVALHGHAGEAATNAFLKGCRQLDELTVRRTNLIRELLCESVENRAKLQCRNARVRARGLLARIGDVLSRELRSSPATMSARSARRTRDMPDFMRSQRELYLAETRSSMDLPMAVTQLSVIDAMVVDPWWNTDGVHFQKLWNDFCVKYDKSHAGHFPVSIFIPQIRAFIASFVRSARYSIRMMLCEDCRKKREYGRSWHQQSSTARFYSGKATGMGVAHSMWKMIFVAHENDGVLFEEMQTCDNAVEDELFKSRLMAEFDTADMLMSYVEVPVRLGRDPEHGVLTMSCAPWGRVLE